MTHFDYGKWADFARDALDATSRTKMQRHLDGGCDRCGRIVASFDRVVRLARNEPAVPEHLVRAAREQYRICRLEIRSRGADSVLRPTFDSWGQLAGVGVRSKAKASRHLVYNSDQLTLDVRMDFSGADHPMQLIGQLIGNAGDPVANVPTFLVGGDRLLSHSRTGPLGEFQMECSTARPLRLCLSLDEARLIEVDLDRRTSRPQPGVSDTILESDSRSRNNTPGLEPQEPVAK